MAMERLVVAVTKEQGLDLVTPLGLGLRVGRCHFFESSRKEVLIVLDSRNLYPS